MTLNTTPLTARQYRALLLALVALYLLTRLPLLGRLPVFVDEASHIYWAQHSPTGGWMDGKLLSIAIMAGFLRGLALEPLLAARLGAVTLSLGSLLLVVAIGGRLGTRAAGLLAGLMYALLPYAAFYDRLALTDQSMILFALLALWLSLLLIRQPRPLLAGALTFALLAALLAKLTGALFAAIPLLVVGILVPPGRWKPFVPPLLLPLGSAAITYAALQARGFGGDQFGDKLADQQSLALAGHNARLVLDWAWGMLTPPLLILLAAALIAALARHRRQDVLLLALLGLAVVPFVLTTRWLYPRYLLFALFPATLLGGRFLEAAGRWLASRIRGRSARLAALAGALLVLAAWPLALQARTMTDPASAPLPERVRWQYVAGWPSGTGLDDLAAFLRGQAAEAGGLTVARFPFLSPANVSLDLVLAPSDMLEMLTLEVAVAQPDFAPQLVVLSAHRRTVLVLSPPVEGQYLAALGVALDDLLAAGTLIWEYPKPDGVGSLQVWEFGP